ncbi:MAG: hypothetical protein QOK23_3864 [Gammaproteobacteria bacterium]|nr:hypothetical protein [Gammaproteobacteria bacterium]
MIHEANEASGGQSSRVEIGSFLRAGAEGPEHQALLRLIGSLVDAPPPVYSNGTRSDAGAANE